MIAVMISFSAMLTLDSYLKFGNQFVGVQLSLASFRSFAFSFSSKTSIAFTRTSSSLVALGFSTRDS